MAQESSYGGQALIGGVMVCGSRLLAAAVRAPDGNIVPHEEPFNAALQRAPISKIPFVRGPTMLWDALGLGMPSLMFSGNVAVGNEREFSTPLAWATIPSFGSSLSSLSHWSPSCPRDGLPSIRRMVSPAGPPYRSGPSSPSEHGRRRPCGTCRS